MLYVDIPTSADIRSLIAARGGPCVSIYLPTTPVTREAQADRIGLKNLAKEAVQELKQSAADDHLIDEIAEQIYDLIDGDDCGALRPMGSLSSSRPRICARSDCLPRLCHWSRLPIAF